MKKVKTLLSTLAILSISATASAETYLGADYALVDVDNTNLGAIILKAGYQFNNWAAFEGRTGFGVRDKSINIDGLDIDVELNNLYGGYFVVRLLQNTNAYPYLIAGYTKAEVEASSSLYSVSVTEDESDFSFGVGANFELSESILGNFEFMRYLDKNESEVNGISLGVTVKL